MILLHTKLEVEGVHCWPESPTREYIKHPHRHIFHIGLKIEASHPDRQKEFFDLQDIMYQTLVKSYSFDEHGVTQFRTDSCEQIALTILKNLPLDLQDIIRAISVYEDNENGAILEVSRNET